MAATNFAARELLPALRRCGLLPTEIASDRKVQEVVYLLERVGVELGYQFKWEVFGPYSVQLAEEVHDLDRELIEAASPESANVAAEAIDRVTTLLDPPAEVELPQEAWLRLVTCIDFVERHTPGATENGGAPPFVARNFGATAITAARERVRELLA